ncbi:MAG: preprotein translocase subunit SecE [bacterium]|nr:preprotein translocase subunit SecE [bacterium]
MNPLKSLNSYLRSSVSELKKVTWPSRQETIRYSALVTGVSLFVAIFFASLDFGLGKLVDATLVRGSSVSATQEPSAPAIVPELETTNADGSIDVTLPETDESIPIDLNAVDGAGNLPVVVPAQ